jgi:hypothetical protein
MIGLLVPSWWKPKFLLLICYTVDYILMYFVSLSPLQHNESSLRTGIKKKAFSFVFSAQHIFLDTQDMSAYIHMKTA